MACDRTFHEKEVNEVSKVILGICAMALLPLASGCASLSEEPKPSPAEYQATVNSIAGNTRYIRDSRTDICFSTTGDFGVVGFTLTAVPDCAKIPARLLNRADDQADVSSILGSLKYIEVEQTKICYATTGDFGAREFTMSAVPSCAMVRPDLMTVGKVAT